MLITGSIPAALARASLVPLPTRDGYLALLPTGPNAGVACPACGCALGMAVIRQRITEAGLAWEYSCMSCARATA